MLARFAGSPVRAGRWTMLSRFLKEASLMFGMIYLMTAVLLVFECMRNEDCKSTDIY